MLSPPSLQLVRTLEILRLARTYGVRLDARHYIVAASACARYGQWKTVTSLLLGQCVRTCSMPCPSVGAHPWAPHPTTFYLTL